jgi:transposase InsO family protein
LGIAPRTLRHWKKCQSNDQIAVRLRGRPPISCSIVSRNEVIRFLKQVSGPVVGLPSLEALFRSIPRVILEDLLRRYRRVWRRRYRQSGFQLTWHHAGAVWAMDFSEANYPIDGIYPYIFAVRDLASHRQLAWQPVADERAETILPILRQLFAEFGPPLVLKSDNGSAFIAEKTQLMLWRLRVAQLFSPARRPQYNGALERSNSTNKTYTHQHATTEGHPYRWISQDLDHACQLANTISRPWGKTGPTPDQVWRQRSGISKEEHQAFQQALVEARIEAADDLGIELTELLKNSDRARLDRLAIARTLEELGYLTKTRVHRPPRKPKRLSRKELTRRAGEYRRKQDPDKVNSTKEPALSLSDASIALVPLPSGALASSSEDKKLSGLILKTKKTLASVRERGTMQRIVDVDLPPPTRDEPSTTPTSAQCERASLSWLRRPITLLVSIFKAANISR